MPKGSSLLLIVWNVILTALVGWSLLKEPAGAAPSATSAEGDSTNTAAVPTPLVRDTGLLKDARIAYFEIDSVEANYKLIDESWSSVEAAKKRLQQELATAQSAGNARLEELAAKEAYMTMAEKKEAQEELTRLDAGLRQKGADAQQEIADMEERVTKKINDEIAAAMEEYNRTAGFDYIFSVRTTGYIWPGNKGLNVTKDIVTLLNARHQASKKK